MRTPSRRAVTRASALFALVGLTAGTLVSWSSGCGSSSSPPEGGVDLFAKDLSLNIKVVDPEGKPVFGASVQVNGVTVPGTSGQDGIIRTRAGVSGSSFGVRISAQSYVDNVQRIDTGGSGEVNAFAPLLKVGTTMSLPNATIDVFDRDSGSATIEPGSFVVADSGAPVTGPVEVSVTRVQPAEVNRIGTFGIKDTPAAALQSLGVLVVSAKSNGVPLEIAPGKKLKISLPARFADGGAFFLPSGTPPPPLWKQSPQVGVWERTTAAFSLVDGRWVAEIDSVGTWNCDYETPVTCAHGRLAMPSGAPAPHVFFSGSMESSIGDVIPANTVLNATTDSTGEFCIDAIPGSKLSIQLDCGDGGLATLGPFNVSRGRASQCSQGHGECSELGTITLDCAPKGENKGTIVEGDKTTEAPAFAASRQGDGYYPSEWYDIGLSRVGDCTGDGADAGPRVCPASIDLWLSTLSAGTHTCTTIPLPDAGTPDAALPGVRPGVVYHDESTWMAGGAWFAASHFRDYNYGKGTCSITIDESTFPESGRVRGTYTATVFIDLSGTPDERSKTVSGTFDVQYVRRSP